MELVKQNRDSLGVFAENRARRGAASSGSSSKHEAEPRPRSISRADTGSMMSHGVEDG